jgi:hypothetical protein
MHEIEAYAFIRSWDYKETSNKAAEYRNITNPGAGVQYNLHFGSEKLKNHFSVGADFKWQTIGMYKLMSGSDINRVDSIDETNIELDSLLANQVINQRSTGIFALYKLEFGNLNLIANVLYDDMQNELTNKMYGLDSAKPTTDISQICTFVYESQKSAPRCHHHQQCIEPIPVVGHQRGITANKHGTWHDSIRTKLGKHVFLTCIGSFLGSFGKNC